MDSRFDKHSEIARFDPSYDYQQRDTMFFLKIFSNRLYLYLMVLGGFQDVYATHRCNFLHRWLI